MRTMMRKQGQAALEFLTTYGWAFLVILIMIGALAYFGVLDPAKFLPQRCQFGTELQCQRFTLDSTQNLSRFELRNALPDPVYINSVQYKYPEEETWRSCRALSSTVTIKRETSGTVVCDDMAGLNSGTKQRVQFRVAYSVGGTAYDSDFTNDLFGEIYANVR